MDLGLGQTRLTQDFRIIAANERCHNWIDWGGQERLGVLGLFDIRAHRDNRKTSQLIRFSGFL